MLRLLSVTVTYKIWVNLTYLTVPGQGYGKYTKEFWCCKMTAGIYL